MNVALYDPALGYYNNSNLRRWGREGDYRTSPDRTELFGATFAKYFADLFERAGRPADWIITEFGSGDGSFAASLLESLKADHPDVFRSTRYIVVEISPDARQRISTRVSEFMNKVDFSTSSSLEQINPGVIFSNEFLDALPVHRLKTVKGELLELYIDVSQECKFVWLPGPLSTPRLQEFITEYAIQLVEGQSLEINLQAEDWLKNVSRTLEAGYIVTVDYGAESQDLYDPQHRYDGSLRGFSKHAFVSDLLSAPGEYDITSTVNWTQVKSVSRSLGLGINEFASLDRFLMQSGLLEILEQQMNKASSDAQKLALSTAAREMILPGGMAASFQVLIAERA